MRQFHLIIAIFFALVAFAIFTTSEGEKRTPALLSLLISNVSMAYLGIEGAIERSSRGPML